jgi:hypothetical protein
VSSTRPTQRELEQARLNGEAARRVGRPRSQGSWKHGGERDQLLSEAWLDGWDSEDQRRRAKR